MGKIWVNHKRIPPPHPKPIEEFEIILLVVKGKMINQVKRSKKDVDEYIKGFYAKYGSDCQAFIIRQSRMNFKSLMQILNEPIK